MRIIDLLNKIANGDIPPKIKYNDIIYEYDNYKGDSGYVDMTQNPYKWFEKEIDCDVKDYLNDEVEVIEDNKKIETLDIELSPDDGDKVNGYLVCEVTRDLAFKINEIIEVLNEKN